MSRPSPLPNVMGTPSGNAMPVPKALKLCNSFPDKRLDQPGAMCDSRLTPSYEGNFPSPAGMFDTPVVGSGCRPPTRNPPLHRRMIREFFLGKTELECSGTVEYRYTSEFAENVSGLLTKPFLNDVVQVGTWRGGDRVVVSHKTRVLVVDDEPAVREVLE